MEKPQQNNAHFWNTWYCSFPKRSVGFLWFYPIKCYRHLCVFKILRVGRKLIWCPHESITFDLMTSQKSYRPFGKAVSCRISKLCTILLQHKKFKSYKRPVFSGCGLKIKTQHPTFFLPHRLLSYHFWGVQGTLKIWLWSNQGVINYFTLLQGCTDRQAHSFESSCTTSKEFFFLFFYSWGIRNVKPCGISTFSLFALLASLVKDDKSKMLAPIEKASFSHIKWKLT